MVNQMKKLRCPRCSKMLKPFFMRKLQHPTGAILDICDKCGGMWLDRNEVALLYQKSAEKQKSKKQSKTKVR
jgi:Zn-finger nucleic acid-binding protein